MKHILHAMGFKLMPLDGKTPIVKDWTNPTFTGYQPALLSGNYGVIMGPEDLVIDVDPRSMPAGRNTIRELADLIGAVNFNTLQVTTGGGGLHIYFKAPEGVKYYKNLADYPGIDVRAYGSQVVGPGSVHPTTGREYSVRVNAPIARVPLNLLQLIRKPEAVINTISTVGEATEEDQVHFRGIVDGTPPAVLGCLKNTAYELACRGRDFGLSPEAVVAEMTDWAGRCSPPLAYEHLTATVQNAYKYGQNTPGCLSPSNVFMPVVDIEELTNLEEKAVTAVVWDQDKSGGLRKSLRNAINIFNELSELQGALRFNLLSRSMEFTRRPAWDKIDEPGRSWTELDAIMTKELAGRVRGFELPVTTWHEAAVVVARENQYNPLTDYLSNIAWDGVHRLDSWLSVYCGAEVNVYTQAVGRKVLLGAVTRAFRPGCKFDYMLIMEGDQGIGKSTAVAILGKNWYGDILLDPSNKDTIQSLCGKWVIEISEMMSYKKSDVDAMKRFISLQLDRVRLPYARTSEDFPRQCIFIGTINPDGMGYLRDTTGNRRFWPVKVGPAFDLDSLTRDVDQLWAEAVVAYHSGESCYITDMAVSQVAMDMAKERRTVDSWFDCIAKFVDSCAIDGTQINQISAGEVYVGALGGTVEKFNWNHKNRINDVMGLLGWKLEIHQYGKQVRQLYVRPQ